MKQVIKTGVVLLIVLVPTTLLALGVGDRAPDFKAPSTHGDIVLSKSLQKGPVILTFYSADFTPESTKEMKMLDDHFDRFEEIGVTIMGVSEDRLVTHWDFTAELGISFLLISDDGYLRKLYGQGRLTYLIDMSGVIRKKYKGMPSIEELFRQIEALP